MPEPSILWLTDRSRYEEGLGTCLRARFLGYHFGPSGYGIQRKSQSIPLATGIYVHQATEAQDQYLLSQDALPGDEVVREGIHLALEEYERVITLRGIRGLDHGERVETIVEEQKALITGLAWAYRLHFLPWLHEQARVISAEREDALVIGCTCGLGDRIGEIADHEARGCQGIGWQARADLITDYRARPGVYAYWEKKTTGQTGERFETEWETKIQFTATAKAAEARLGIPISEAWIVALIKGRRVGEYNWETKTNSGPKIQQSPLCYGYRRPANPPMEEVDWQASYDYVGTDGKNHRLGKAYQKTGIWAIVQDMPEVAAQFSVAEFWAKWMPAEKLAQQLALVGPLQISAILSESFFREALAHEQRWRAIVWQLYDVLQNEAGGDWTHPAYQGALEELLPRSWACRRYGKNHQCQFVPICHQHEGWQDPIGSGVYVDRRPHHTPELLQIEARGLTPEGGWTDEEEVD